jgi:hypothetical protein
MNNALTLLLRIPAHIGLPLTYNKPCAAILTGRSNALVIKPTTIASGNRLRSYSSVVPSLISIESNIRRIFGSYFFQEFSAISKDRQKCRFHYRLILKKDILTPKEYDFRNGYYFKLGKCWYYNRKLFVGLTLKLKYDPQSKTFYFNRLYSLLPFEIGGLIPVGKHIADFINLDLFLSGFDVIRGLAYQHQGKTISCIVPALNGKTTLMKKILENGGKYIAEDIIIRDRSKNTVYPTVPIRRNYGRWINTRLKSLASKNALHKEQKIDTFYLAHNSTGTTDKNLGNGSFFSYYMINSLLFLDNRMIRSYLFTENLWDSVFDTLRSSKNDQQDCQELHIKNFDFSSLFNYNNLEKMQPGKESTKDEKTTP